MSIPVPPADTRHCAWSDEEREGKHYVLTSTEGQELVSEAAFRSGVDPEVHGVLVRRVAKLERLVDELRGGTPKVPAQRKAG